MKKKYGNGTGRGGVVNNYIENPNDALLENQIAINRAEFEAASNPWIQGLQAVGGLAMNQGMSMIGGASIGDIGADLGALGKQTAAYGGKVKGGVEVEGEEVAETPGGQLLDFKGPSHEAGGIDIDLPGGTEIYSKRVKVDGVSMADRKKKREKKELTLEKLLEMNPTDAVNKNTLNRTKKNNKAEETRDLKTQELIAKLVNPEDNKFALGTPPGGIDIAQLLQVMTQGGIPTSNTGFPIEDVGNPNTVPTVGESKVLPIPTEPFLDTTIPLRDGTPINLPKNENQDLTWKSTPVGNTDIEEGAESNFLDTLNLMTGGDAVGMVGNLISTFKPMDNTLENRAKDTPNINHFEDFGNDALDVLDESKGLVGDVRDNALSDLETARTGNVKRNRNTARGVNTMRSLDLAASAQANQVQKDIYDNFAKQLMSIFSQEAGIENQQDSMVMQGAERKDIADRMDIDNFYSQMAQDIATKGTGLQETSYDLNQMKLRQSNTEVLKQLEELGYDDNQIAAFIDMMKNMDNNSQGPKKTKK